MNNRVINGTEIVELENANIHMKGRIVLDGNASLKVTRSTMYMSEMIELRGNSTFECINSTLIGYKNETVLICARENSVLRFSGVELQESPQPQWSGITIPWVYLYGNSTLNGERLKLDNLSTYENASCVLRESSLRILGAISSIPAKLINCTVHDLDVIYWRTDVNITENHHGYQEYWFSKETLGETIRLNCILINSTLVNPIDYSFNQCTVKFMNVSASSIRTYGDMNLTVENANIDDLDCSHYGDLKLRVKNSTIGELSSWISNIDVVIEDSRIGEVWMESRWQAHVRFRNCVIGWYKNDFFNLENVSISDSVIENITFTKTTMNPLTLKNTTITNFITGRQRTRIKTSIDGSIRFTEDAKLILRYDTGITEVVRTFPVQVTQNGEPVGQVKVFLKRDNETIERLTTAENGTTEFQISFLFGPEYNDTVKYNLQVEDLEPVQVTLLTDTPIEIILPRKGSIWNYVTLIYSVALMVSLTLLAILYLRMRRG